jgi:hypothetical protein
MALADGVAGTSAGFPALGVVGHWSTITQNLKALGYPEEIKIEP